MSDKILKEQGERIDNLERIMFTYFGTLDAKEVEKHLAAGDDYVRKATELLESLPRLSDYFDPKTGRPKQ